MQCCNNINCLEKGRVCVAPTSLPRIVIVGGGFAGLNLAKELKNKPVQVVLVDKNNFHQFLPLTYQVATSGIEPDNIVFPFRKIFSSYRNIIFRMAEALNIDQENNSLSTTLGSIDYNFLVLANGSVTNFFGNEGFENHGLGLKSITDSLDIRSKLLQNLEKATVTCLEEDKRRLGSIVVAGGGPAGVEIAGALAEFKRYILPKDYPELNITGMKIYLVEAMGGLLRFMPPKLSEKTKKYLTDMKVDIRLNNFIKSYDGTTVTLENGETIEAATFIWTAGVKGAPVKGLPPESLNSQKRILVDNHNRVKSTDNVFAIGDIAQMKTEKYPDGHPMVAQVAIQQGKVLAANLMKIIKMEPVISFKYNDKGSMSTIGKKKAVATIFNLSFYGFFAWLIWSFIHLMSIMGIRNKLLVAVNWLWSYFTYEKGNRVIIRTYKNVYKKKQDPLFTNLDERNE